MRTGDERGSPDHTETDPSVTPQQRPGVDPPAYPAYAQPFSSAAPPPETPPRPAAQPVPLQQPPGYPVGQPYSAPTAPPYGAPAQPYAPPWQPAAPQGYPPAQPGHQGHPGYQGPPVYTGVPQRFGGTPYPAPPPQPPKRRWTFWLFSALAAVLVLCVLPAAGAIGVVIYADRAGTGAGKPTASTSMGPARKPVAGDRWDVYRDWMVDRVNEAIDARDKALVRNDQAAYLAFGDPRKPSAITVLKRQFAALQQLKVASWTSDVKGLPLKESGEGFDAIWKVDIVSHSCFGTEVCEESTSVRTELWCLVAEKPRVQEVRISTEEQIGPRPWEVADLRALAGERAIVATTQAYAKNLPQLSADAEKAAKVADRLAFGKPPSRYLIFYASPSEWRTWYSWTPPTWAAGVSISTGELRTEIVLNAAVVSKSLIDNTLRHEMTHASSVPGQSGDVKFWWLQEGIAEYAEMDGSPVRLYSELPLVRSYVRANSWDGKVAVKALRSADPETEVGAKYGISFLAIRQLAERYTEAKMLEFYIAVVHDGESENAASEIAFGKPWSTVEAELAAYVRSSVR